MDFELKDIWNVGTARHEPELFLLKDFPISR